MNKEDRSNIARILLETSGWTSFAYSIGLILVLSLGLVHTIALSTVYIYVGLITIFMFLNFIVRSIFISMLSNMTKDEKTFIEELDNKTK